ncbi:MAG: TonB-dependent receptor, partial [Burkholderiales bacterium]|nr:TonB-dependent receptor [Burkholderiales bacterium]
MKFPLKALTLAIASISYVSIAAAEDTPNKVQRVEVTGSNIKRISKEGPAPVLVLTRKDIEKTGATTVSELLSNLPVNSTGNYSESFTSGFSPGSSAVSLRGLGSKSTLTLLNGRRLANYGFAQNLQETSVDLNSIPQEAVERIEILKDGASAIYGADAIAGVINIILRKDYQGAIVSAKAGTTTEGGSTEYSASFGGGKGSLSEDGFNVMGVFQAFKRDGLMYTDRSIYNGGDPRSLVPGSTENWSTLSEYPTYRRLAAKKPGDNIFAASTQPAANCPADRVKTLSSASSPACITDLTPYGVLVPETSRFGFTGRGVLAINDNTQVFAEVLLNRNETKTPGAPATWGNSSTFTSTGSKAVPLTLPVGHPNNPYNVPVGLSYRFTDLGQTDAKVTADLFRLVIGAKGSFMNWDWEVAALESRGKTVNNQENLLSTSGLLAVLKDQSYNFIDKSKNTPEVLNKIRANTERVADTAFRQVDGKVSGTLYELPAGPLQMAAGIEFREESLEDVSSDNLSNFDILGRGYTTTVASRRANSIYTELNIPVIQSTEIQLALRRDSYNDFGSAVTPKAAFRFQPTKEFLLRGSYSQGFRAPTFAENGEGAAYSFQTVKDKQRCDATLIDPKDSSKGFKVDPVTGKPYLSSNYCSGVSTSTRITPNRDVKPEESRSFALGFIFEPNEYMTLGVDWYNIEQSNLIIRPSAQKIVDDGITDKIFRGDPTANDIARNLPGAINIVQRQYAQLDQKTTVEGLDIDLTLRSPKSEYGRLSFNSNIGLTLTREEQEGPGEAMESINGIDGNPRIRARTTLSWDKDGIELSLSNNLIGGWDYKDPAIDSEKVVPSLSTYDVQASYSFNKAAKLTLGSS